MERPPTLTLDQLRTSVSNEKVDTVIVAFADRQGRLQGKRVTAAHFLDRAAGDGIGGCGDAELTPDLGTLRLLGWHDQTALCLADQRSADGAPVVTAPRQVLRAQLDRLRERGYEAFAGTELEFIVFRDTYEAAQAKRYANLRPANRDDRDQSILGGSRVEPLLGRIRREMDRAGLAVESSLGQHALGFGCGPALRIADEHVIYKTGAKEIAAQEKLAITFMAKYSEREGSSCHVHLSLRTTSGTPVFASDRTVLDRFIAGQLACLRELTLFYAPNINSYKRYARGSFAVAWGRDDRTCAVRVVGHGDALRIELRVPGADVNPYLALAAMLAAGMHGLDHDLELEPPLDGDAHAADKPRVPATLGEAHYLFAHSDVAKAAFGDEVVAHYLNAAWAELDAFESVVTDWERARGFEQL